MLDFSEMGQNVPAFLTKLWKLTDDVETNDVICWSSTGQSFLILNTVKFTHELLPLYFKHNNMASFIRQLNMYGFRKITSISSGNLRSLKEYMEFSHTYFIKGHPYLLENIKRKLPISRNPGQMHSFADGDTNDGKTQDQSALAQVLADVNNLKSEQTLWNKKLDALKTENETLWRELAIFRQKHRKQEQIINKLIHFIVTMVRPSSRNVPLRRRIPLMINDSEKSGSTSGGPTIRELNPIELLLGNDSDNGATLKSDSIDCLLPQPNIDELTLENISTPYQVLSPSDLESSTVDSPWIHVASPVEASKEMTPINPAKVNPAAAALALSDTSTAQPSVKKIDRKYLKRKNGKSGRNARKNSQPVKRIRKTQQPPQKDLLAAALNLMGDDDLTSPIDLTEKGFEVENEVNNKLSGIEFKMEAEEEPKPCSSKSLSPFPGSFNNTEGAVVLARPNLVPDRDNAVARYDQLMDLGHHVDIVQGDIDILKELFKGEGYNLDANALLELFNDDPMNLIMSPLNEEKGDSKEGGQELMKYETPNLNLNDLADMYTATPCLQNSSPPHLSPSMFETPVHTPLTPGFSISPTQKSIKKANH